MFIILKSLDWKPEDYTNKSIVPFGWIEDNGRGMSREQEIVAKVHTKDQLSFLLKKLNNQYLKGLM